LQKAIKRVNEPPFPNPNRKPLWRRLAPWLLPLPALLLLLAGAWQYRQPLLNDWLKPRIETLLARQLGGEASIGGLLLERDRLEVTALELRSGGEYALRMASIEAEFDWRGLLRRQLRSLRVTAPALTWRPAPAAGRRPPPELPDWTVATLELAGGSLAVDAGGHRYHAAAIDLRWREGEPGRFTLAAKLGATHPVPLAVAGTLRAPAAVEIVLQQLRWADRELLAQPVALSFGGSGGVQGAGRLQLPALDRAAVARLLSAFDRGDLLPPGLDFAFQGIGIGFSLGRSGLQWQGEIASGRMELAGFSLPIANLHGTWSERADGWQADGTLASAAASTLRWHLTRAGSRLSGTLDGHTGDPAALAALWRPGTRWPLAGALDWRLELERSAAGLELQVRVTGRKGESPRPNEISLALLQLRGDARLRQDRRGRWQGPLHLAGGPLPVGSLQAERLTLTAKLAQQPQGLAVTALDLHGAAAGAGLRIGRLQLRGEGRWRPGGLHATVAELSLDGGEYQAADGLTGLGRSALRLAGAIDWQSAKRLIDWRLAGRLQAGEVLHQAFYGDLSALPADLSAAGSWRPADGTLAVDRFSLGLEPFGRVTGAGRLGPNGWQLTARAGLPGLGTLFNDQLQAMVAPLATWAGGLTLDGGLSLTFTARRTAAGGTAAGELASTGLSLAAKDGSLRVDRLRGKLPFRTHWGEEKPVADEREGLLAFDRIAAGPAALESAQLELTAGDNRWSFATPWTITLGGGRITLDGVTIDGPFGAWGITARTRMSGIELGRLTHDFGILPLAGRIDADLGRISYRQGRLETAGQAEIRVFGGRIDVSNLRAEDLFSRYRSFQGDIEMTGLDLSQLTRTFAFGEINGIVDGYVHDLRLFGTVPSRFQAALHSRDSGTRNISVKALNNLAVLSQGGIAAALSRGIYRFIDFYRYRKIGILCTLQNDQFLLRGDAREGVDNYLVYGGWLPPKIDVLAPRTAVSFKEMLRRLERVGR
jgi:translocation and assembly module TamB